MGNISPQMVKQLRDLTGVGMNKCKEALEQSQGDMDKAIEFLRKAGMSAAVKKEGRETKEGAIVFFETAKTVSLLEINCETDFVAKNEKFVKFAGDLSKQMAEEKLPSLSALLNAKTSFDKSITVEQYRNLVIQSLGENIQVRRVELISKKDNCSYGIYSHMGGKIVSIVEIEGSTNEQLLAKDIAMHVVAENPEYLSSSDVPEEVKLKEKEIARAQITNKPENVIEKILEGKLKAYFDQFCLLNQKFVKDPSLSILQFIEKKSKTLKLSRFWRWRVG